MGMNGVLLSLNAICHDSHSDITTAARLIPLLGGVGGKNSSSLTSDGQSARASAGDTLDFTLSTIALGGVLLQ